LITTPFREEQHETQIGSWDKIGASYEIQEYGLAQSIKRKIIWSARRDIESTRATAIPGT
jgi:hypothetical protein